MSWSSVLGQDRVKEILKSTLQQQRLAHAYLFFGPEGVGKYTAALELAKAIHCEQSVTDPCDRCKSCIKMRTLQHPNLSLIFALPAGKGEEVNDPPLAKLGEAEIESVREQLKLKAENPYHRLAIEKANNIKINSIRQIRRSAIFTSYEKGKKIFLIINADDMADAASNALLKTLEEPDANTLFILTTSALEKLLPTIVSRCQTIRFDAVPDEAIEDQLIARQNIDPRLAKTIAQLSEGNFQKALLYANSDFLEEQKKALEFLNIMLFKSRRNILSEVEELSRDYSRDDILMLLQQIQCWYRDAMLIQEDHIVGFSEDYKKSLADFHKIYPKWNYLKTIHSIEKAISHLDKNVYIPLILVNLAISLRRALNPSFTR